MEAKFGLATSNGKQQTAKRTVVAFTWCGCGNFRESAARMCTTLLSVIRKQTCGNVSVTLAARRLTWSNGSYVPREWSNDQVNGLSSTLGLVGI